MSYLKRWFDLDQLLIFFLLAVTINQMGHYLATFAPAGFEIVGYLQAAGVDLAIWRSAFWYRRYTGKKQRRWALVGVVLFAAVSTWYNRGYYHLADPSLVWWQAWLMGAILPAGVALLSFLKGQKDESKFGHKDTPAKEQEAHFVDSQVDFVQCDQCSRPFTFPNDKGGEYANQRAAQNAKNAHRCVKVSDNGHGPKEKVSA